MFWDLSPTEFFLYELAYHKSVDIDYEVQMTVGYNSAICVMNPKAPTLDRFLNKKTQEFEADDMSDDELNEELAAALMEFRF